MKHTAVLTAAALAFASPAIAADKAGPTSPAISASAPIEAYSWTGTYAGIHAGFVREDVEDKLAGIHVGYRHHQGMIVYGAELGATMANPRDPSFDNVLFAATASIGVAFDRLLISAKGGYALNEHVDGFTYGLGADFAITDNWTIGIEAMRTDLGIGDVDTVLARVSRRF